MGEDGAGEEEESGGDWDREEGKEEGGWRRGREVIV